MHYPIATWLAVYLIQSGFAITSNIKMYVEHYVSDVVKKKIIQKNLVKKKHTVEEIKKEWDYFTIYTTARQI